jgi:hypothetical protein
MRTFAGVMKDAEMFVVRGSPPPVEPNADPAAFVDISALGGNSPDHIFGR